MKITSGKCTTARGMRIETLCRVAAGFPAVNAPAAVTSPRIRRSTGAAVLRGFSGYFPAKKAGFCPYAPKRDPLGCFPVRRLSRLAGAFSAVCEWFRFPELLPRAFRAFGVAFGNPPGFWELSGLAGLLGLLLARSFRVAFAPIAFGYT